MLPCFLDMFLNRFQAPLLGVLWLSVLIGSSVSCAYIASASVIAVSIHDPVDLNDPPNYIQVQRHSFVRHDLRNARVFAN